MTRAAGAALLGAALAFVAALFDTPSLYVPGLALLVLGVGCGVWVALAAHGARVERTPGARTVEEGAPYPVRMQIRPGLVPPPGGELHEPLLDGPVPLGPLTARRLRIDVRFERRGRRLVEPGRLAIHDPLRLAVRELSAGDEPQELLVLPRVEPVLAPAAGGGGAGAGVGLEGGDERASWRGRLAGSAAELDLDGLRPYREGTPASRIHWPAVARSGEMLERRLSADADSAPLVVLDASRPPSEEALDMAVRAAASLCAHLARRGGCALLLPGDRRPAAVGADQQGWHAVHARLALVEAARSRPAPGRVRRAGAVLWVSARPDAPRDLTRAAGTGAWLVTPGATERGTFTVAGCTGRRLDRSSRPAGRAA